MKVDLSPKAAVVPKAAASIDGTTRIAGVTIAVLLGVFLIAGTGFLQADVLHNAAHDARHAFGFPCH